MKSMLDVRPKCDLSVKQAYIFSAVAHRNLPPCMHRLDLVCKFAGLSRKSKDRRRAEFGESLF
jgi:hypothetical protein